MKEFLPWILGGLFGGIVAIIFLGEVAQSNRTYNTIEKCEQKGGHAVVVYNEHGRATVCSKLELIDLEK